MSDFVKKALCLGLGTISITKEKIQENVNEMIKQGEITSQEGAKVLDMLLERGRKNKEDIEVFLQNKLDEALAKTNLAHKNEIDELKAQLAELKQQLKDQQNTTTGE